MTKCAINLTKISVSSLTDAILDGYRIKRGDDLSIFLTADLEELEEGAGKLQKYFCGNYVDLCTIINGRSGRCSENCKYCAQAACYQTGIDEYGFLSEEEIIKNAKINEKAGVNRFSIVTAGRALKGRDFEKALKVYKRMKKELHLGLCASHGLLEREQFRALKEAGVENYHHNIETSKRFFSSICTTHTYDDKIRTIKIAQEEGLNVCSGGIIGMGENFFDRLDMAISLSELNIKSIPINLLTPIPGTDLEHREIVSTKDAMRTIAFFRFINPDANIRLAAGRKVLPKNGELAFQKGASASITGNMLTTSGTTIAEDIAMLKRLGMTNKRENLVTMFKDKACVKTA